MQSARNFDVEGVMLATRQRMNLAQAICLAGGIRPHGQELIAVIGQGHEASNLEALGSWIINQNCTNLEILATQLADEIQSRLAALSSCFQAY